MQPRMVRAAQRPSIGAPLISLLMTDAGLARIFHQDAELWRRTGRDRSGSTGAANRTFYWQDGHARYGRPGPARIRVTPIPIWAQTKRSWIGCTGAPANKRGWPGEISGRARSRP